MPSQAGRVALAADRWTPFVETFVFRGLNLTGATLHAQIRITADAPGDPLINLPGGVASGAEGLHLASVDTSGPYPVSTVEMRILEATLEDASHAPASATPGDSVTLAWDLHVTPPGQDKQRLLYGPFTIVAGVTRS